MEAPKRVLAYRGVLGDGCRDPWMGQLHQERSTGPEEHDGFAIDPPKLRGRPEHPCAFPRGLSPNELKATFQVGDSNGLSGFSHDAPERDADQ